MNMIKLARKYEKSSKNKSKLILVAIILSTCLITTICTFSYSIYETNIKNIKESYGTAQAKFKEVTDEQINILKNHIQLKKSGLYSNLGHVKDTNNYNLSLLYADKNATTLLAFEIKEGKLPEKENEIAVHSSVLTHYKKNIELGQKIKLNYIMGNKESYHEDEKEFIVTGIIRDNSLYNINSSGIGLVSKEFMDILNKNLIKKNIAFELKDNNNINNKVYNIASDNGISKDKISFNTMLLESQGQKTTSIIPFIIIGLVVILATILVIYNIYYISVVERIQQIGTLSSIGTSPKQLKKMVRYEGLLSSIKGIPLGILLGYFISYILVPLIPFTKKVQMSFSIYIILISAITSFITVIIASRKPSKMASKISPIEAMSYSGVTITGKKSFHKTKKSIFGSIGKIAYLNLWRNKKRTLITILSLTMSGILFITFSSIFNSMSIDNLIKNYISADFEITNYYKSKDSTDTMNHIINEIEQIDGVESIITAKHISVSTAYDSNKMNPDKKGYTINGNINCDVLGYNDKTFNQLSNNIIRGTLDIDKLKNEKYIIYSGDKNEDNYNPGDKILLSRYIDEDISYEEEFTILAITDSLPIGLTRHQIGPTWIAHNKIIETYFKENNIFKICIHTKKEMNKQIKPLLEKLINNYPKFDIASYVDLYNEFNKQKSSMQFIGYTLVFIIGLIGLLNLINTMVTSILTRKKELGMLQAIGLSNKQLRRMLQIEGLYYSLISGISATVFGTIIAKIFFNLFSKEATYAKWQSPIKEILLMLFILITIQYILTNIITKKINKQTIIDRII